MWGGLKRWFGLEVRAGSRLRGGSASSVCCRTWGERCRRRCRLQSPVGHWKSSIRDPSALLVLSSLGLELPLCTWHQGKQITHTQAGWNATQSWSELTRIKHIVNTAQRRDLFMGFQVPPWHNSNICKYQRWEEVQLFNRLSAAVEWWTNSPVLVIWVTVCQETGDWLCHFLIGENIPQTVSSQNENVISSMLALGQRVNSDLGARGKHIKLNCRPLLTVQTINSLLDKLDGQHPLLRRFFMCDTVPQCSTKRKMKRINNKGQARNGYNFLLQFHVLSPQHRNNQ